MTNRVKLFTDGGSRGNPGPGAIGILILDGDDNELERFNERIGYTTNNRAEYHALIKGLDLAAKHTRHTVLCHLDSQLVVRQVQGLWKLKQEELRELFLQVKVKERLFKKVTYIHLRRNDSFMKIVDRLVNEALDEKRTL